MIQNILFIRKNKSKLLGHFYFKILLLFALSTSAQYTKLLDFAGLSNGKTAAPYGSLACDGTFLYGMMQNGGTSDMGIIFKIKTDGTTFSKLHDFSGLPDGRAPQGSLIYDGTWLYGMTTYGGTYSVGIIFKIKPDGSSYTKLHDFGNNLDGGQPFGSLFFDGTWLYGTTWNGGISNFGIVFRLMPDGSNYTKLHDFNEAGGANPMTTFISDGTYLYGTADIGSFVFRLKPDGSSYSIVTSFTNPNYSGTAPIGSLYYDGTYLFGTLSQGGANGNCGTLYKVKPDGSSFTKLLDFGSPGTGCFPYPNVIPVGNYLFGAAGYIFEIKPDGTNYSNAFCFTNVLDGHGPTGIISNGTNLYGMTMAGGANGMGVIFSLDFATVSIEEQKLLSNSISISPNPGNGKFNLSFKYNAAVCSVEVYDALGQSIYKNEHLGSSNEIDLSQHSSGVYYIHVQNNNEKAVSKLVIQR